MGDVGMVSAIEGAAGPGSVLIAGGGLWADALSRVVTKGGGGLLLGTSRDHALSLISTHRPSAIVVARVSLRPGCSSSVARTIGSP